MQQHLDDIQATGARVFGLSVDGPDVTTTMAERWGFRFPILCDPKGQLIDALGLRHVGGHPSGTDIARPVTLVFDEGVIVWRFVPDNWRVRLRSADLVAALRALPPHE